MLKICSWVIYNSIRYSKNSLYLNKPFNSILGEFFECNWNNDEDKTSTYYIGEQVTHHPPLSAFYSYNEKTNITYEGWCEPKGTLSLFYNLATTTLEGNFRITLHNNNDEKILNSKICYN